MRNAEKNHLKTAVPNDNQLWVLMRRKDICKWERRLDRQEGNIVTKLPLINSDFRIPNSDFHSWICGISKKKPPGKAAVK